MAGFNFQEYSKRLTLEQLIERVSSTFKNLGLLLKGIRTEDDGRHVFDHELEVEEDGGGLIVTTPDGSARYRIAVDNSGNVTSTAL